MIKKAVILCGGWGTRFLPTSKGVSKELLPLYDKPILQILVDDLVKNGVLEIAFIIRPDKTDIIKYFSLSSAFENVVDFKQLPLLQNYRQAKFCFISQNSSRGTGDALSCAKEWVGQNDFFVLNGDEIIDSKQGLIGQMLDTHNKTHASVLGVKRVLQSDVSKYGIVDIEESGKIKNIVEKPDKKYAPSKFASIGAYILSANIFDYIKEGDDMPLTDAISDYCKHHPLYSLNVRGRRYDLGTPLGFVLSNLEYALNNTETRGDVVKKLRKLGFHYVQK